MQSTYDVQCSEEHGPTDSQCAALIPNHIAPSKKVPQMHRALDENISSAVINTSIICCLILVAQYQTVPQVAA